GRLAKQGKERGSASLAKEGEREEECIINKGGEGEEGGGGGGGLTVGKGGAEFGVRRGSRVWG
ncbi:hypothetical protein Ancab_007709, partial [Ancistrocladus abbreviatus]